MLSGQVPAGAGGITGNPANWSNQPVAGPIPNNLFQNQPSPSPFAAPQYAPGAQGGSSWTAPSQGYQPNFLNQFQLPLGYSSPTGTLTPFGSQMQGQQNMLPWLMGGQFGQGSPGQSQGNQFNPQFMNIPARFPNLFQQLGLGAQQGPGQGMNNASFYA